MVCWSFCILLLGSSVLANTEIVNFSAQKDSAVDLSFTNSWPILSSKSPTFKFNGTSAPLDTVLPQPICPTLAEWHPERQSTCPHELWVVLDIDGNKWKRVNKFTLRLSWPAFYPTDFSITIYDPTSLSAFSKHPPSTQAPQTRRKYARIQMVHTGILTYPDAPFVEAAGPRYHVPMSLILEPLYFGFIPRSIIPTAFAIVIAALVCLPVATELNRILSKIVLSAEEELMAEQKAKIQ